mgnify:CR=1 FL=1
MNIKNKLSNINTLILDKEILLKLINLSWKKYNIDDLVNLWYVSVIKRWRKYYNNMINWVKNPYIIWWTYMDFKDFMFWWFEQYNKKWFNTQISNIFTIYNLKYSRNLNILWLRFNFKKVKSEFFFGKERKIINGFTINYMSKERLFLEFVREYIDYDNDFFINIYRDLNIPILNKYIKRYPLKNVTIKINKIKKCL